MDIAISHTKARNFAPVSGDPRQASRGWAFARGLLVLGEAVVAGFAAPLRDESRRAPNPNVGLFVNWPEGRRGDWWHPSRVDASRAWKEVVNRGRRTRRGAVAAMTAATRALPSFEPLASLLKPLVSLAHAT
jgi:hypothetical protein